MSIPPRVVEHSTRPSFSWQLPYQGWRAILAGVEAALIGWIGVVLIAIGAYVATAAEAALGSASWLDAAQVGTAIWLLGHGGGIALADAAITVIPWGIGILAVISARTCIRRSGIDSPIALAWALGGYVGVQIALIILSGVNSWQALAGSLAVVALGGLWGIAPNWPWHTWLSSKLPSWVSAGLRLGLWITAAVMILAALATAASLIIYRSEALEIHRALATDTVSSILLVVAQLLLIAPVLIAWAVSFLAGPGFSMGEGTLFSAAIVESGPLPAVPILAALPDSVPPGLGSGLTWLLILGSAGGGLYLHRHRFTLLQVVAAVAITALTTGVITGVLVAMSSGSVGPGSMAVVGGASIASAWGLSWKILLGAGAITIALHPQTVKRVRAVIAWLKVWWQQVRGTAHQTTD